MYDVINNLYHLIVLLQIETGNVPDFNLFLLSCCLKCRKYTESKNPRAAETNKRKPMLLSECEVSDSKKSRFIKEQEASGLLNSLGLKTYLSKIPVLGDILF